MLTSNICIKQYCGETLSDVMDGNTSNVSWTHFNTLSSHLFLSYVGIKVILILFIMF